MTLEIVKNAIARLDLEFRIAEGLAIAADHAGRDEIAEAAQRDRIAEALLALKVVVGLPA